MPRRKGAQNAAKGVAKDALLTEYDAQLGPPSTWREALVREQTRKAVAEARKAELEALEAARRVFTVEQFEAAVRAVQHAWSKAVQTLPQRVLARLSGLDAGHKALLSDALLAELRRCGALVAEELRARPSPGGDSGGAHDPPA